MEVVRLLTEAGADIHKADDEGDTALDIAAQKVLIICVQAISTLSSMNIPK